MVDINAPLSEQPCECGHPLKEHPSKDKCNQCGCNEFRFAVEKDMKKKVRELKSKLESGDKEVSDTMKKYY